MSKRYTGNFISGTPQVPTLTSNNGVFDIKDAYTATSNNTWQEADGYYEIPRSLRFRSSNNVSLNRIPGISSNRNTWTWSAWVKWTGVATQLFGVTSGYGGSSTQEDNRLAIQLSSDGQFQFYEFASASFAARKYSTAKFKDPAAWYHLMVSVNYKLPDANNRIRMYVNGVELTSFESITTPTQNLTSYMNGSGNNHTIGGQIKQYNNFYDGHIAEQYVIDGLQLDPSYFGYFDPITNIWQPKPYGAPTYVKYQATAGMVTNSGFGGFDANAVVDGSNTSGTAFYADSAGVGSYVLFDLGAGNAKAFRKFSFGVYKSTSNGLKMAVKAQYSDDNSTWYDCSSVVDSLAEGQGYLTGEIFQLGARWNNVGAHRYWRLYKTDTASGGDYCQGIDWYEVSADSDSYYGENGFYLNFSDNSGGYNWQLCADKSGNENNFRQSGVSLSPGPTYDSMVDSPTNIFTTAADVGGVVSGNYPTIDPLEPLQTYITYSDANLSWSQTAAAGWGPRSTTKATVQLPKTGKWVFAITIGSSGNNAQFGIARRDDAGNPSRAQYGTTIVLSDYAVMNPTGGVVKNGSEIYASGVSIGVGDELQCAVDCDAGTVSWYRNGTYLGQATGMPTTTNDYWPMTFGASSGASGSGSWNFGQRPFAYTPPAGYKTLNTTNLQALGTSITGKAAIQPFKWMDTNLYGGLGGLQQIKNFGKFQPDLVWVKSRSTATFNNILVDSVRGAGNILVSDTNGAEGSAANYWVTSLDSDGFTLGSAGANGTNATGSSYVGWQWKQSPNSGFNIVPYTANGTANRAISHNLGVTPSMIIVKSRNSAVDWNVWFKGFSANEYTKLNTNEAKGSYNTLWYQTPTSSNFYIGSTGTGVNYTNGEQHIAYLWAEVPGFSKFGTYIGNSASDGPLIQCGFRPAWIMIKRIDAARNWYIKDNRRPGDNRALDNSGQPGNDGRNANLSANNANAEETSFHGCYILSNGFKISTGETATNEAGGSYIYAAFAEAPFALNNRAR